MKQEMNLLPVVPGKKKRESEPKSYGKMIFLGLVLGVLMIYGVLAYLDLRCRNEIEELEAIIETKSEYQVIYDSLSHQKAVLEYRQLILESISKRKEQPLQTMVEIHKVLPAGVRLSNYNFEDGRLIISGETQKQEEIIEFKEKLAGLDIFKAINMVNTNKKEGTAADYKPVIGEELWEFTLDIQVTEV
ncbi:hypothetical protein GH811_06315 [Acetobacterium malicum]|uniref:Fimbrial assembly protein n=2 Tax=Acetobacterium malicum TaxID=52692 RepID=A0ABR6YVK9_9FIRM|nr:hypothetical protein [Acetobacterium malicum]